MEWKKIEILSASLDMCAAGNVQWQAATDVNQIKPVSHNDYFTIFGELTCPHSQRLDSAGACAVVADALA